MRRSNIIIYLAVYAVSFALLLWKHVTRLSDFRYGVIGLILFGVALYWETKARENRLANWNSIRIQGKVRFILIDYVLLRGGIVSLLILLILSTKVTIGLLVIASVIPLLGGTAFVGNEEWKYCEEQYIISTLKSAAESMKAIQN